MSCPPVRLVSASSAVLALVILVVGGGCGKKGAPLPPLVKIPAAPPAFTAERHGETVDLGFTVPAANTDGSRPANIERVDVYAMTGSPSATVEQLLTRGTLISRVPVKAPRDPNDTVDAEETDEDLEPLEGRGRDQGSTVQIEETLGPSDFAPAVLPNADVRPASSLEDASWPRPLGVPSAADLPSRTYVCVGITTRGRRGAVSARASVPLVALPPSPSPPVVSYDEREITVTWTAAMSGEIQPEATGDVLPGRPIGLSSPKFAYNVYEVSTPLGSGDGVAREERLTKTPVEAPEYTDKRIQWGVERCYTVRTVETIETMSLEGTSSPVVCKKVVDTFPPAAPKGLTAVASAGAISLIWQPNDEKDLAGYVVLRGVAPGDATEQLTPKSIEDTTYADTVKPGVTYVYVVKAVDRSGNVSSASNRAEETGR